MKSDSKQKIAKLPPILRTAASKLKITKPNEDVPSWLIDKVNNPETEESFTLEMNENEQFKIAEWVFELAGKPLPDKMDDTSDYIKQIGDFSRIIVGKIFNIHKENGDLKPCPFYQENEKISVVGRADRKQLNDDCKEMEKAYEKGAIYAEHYKITPEFEELDEFEQGLFYWYCFENSTKNTLSGKK